MSKIALNYAGGAIEQIFQNSTAATFVSGLDAQQKRDIVCGRAKVVQLVEVPLENLMTPAEISKIQTNLAKRAAKGTNIRLLISLEL